METAHHDNGSAKGHKEANFFTVVISTIRTGLKTLLAGFIETLIIWYAVLGFVSLAFFIWGKGYLAVEPWHALFELIATVFLAGSAFEVLVKSMQYSGVFKKELQNVMIDPDFVASERKKFLATISADDAKAYFVDLITKPPIIDAHKQIVASAVEAYDERFLKSRKDIDKFWAIVSKIVYEKTFPEIGAQIAQRILEEYFPKEGNFYYHDFVETLSVKLHDDRHLELTEATTFTLRALDPSQKVVWRFTDEVMKRPSDEITNCYLDQLRIDPYSKSDALQDSNLKIECSPDRTKVLLACSVELTDSSAYEFRVRAHKIYDPEVDPTIFFTNKRFINNLEVNIDSYPADELEVVFAPIGLRPRKEESGHGDGSFWYKYKDLLFPYQGYRLTFRRRFK